MELGPIGVALGEGHRETRQLQECSCPKVASVSVLFHFSTWRPVAVYSPFKGRHVRGGLAGS